MKVLILGHNGMLGHMLHKYLLTKKCKIITVDERWPSNEFKNTINNLLYKSEIKYAVNCIAKIPQKESKDFSVNVDLPIWLENKFMDVNIIYPGTDMDSEGCSYGTSKKIATDFIINESKNTKIIKTSVIGPEIKSKKSVFEWFINSDDTVYGWDKHYWNGVTSLEWSKLCYKMILDWDSYGKVNVPSTNCISKYNLLCIIKEVFNKKITIHKNSKVEANRCLSGDIEVEDIKKQLIELKEFYYDN